LDIAESFLRLMLLVIDIPFRPLDRIWTIQLPTGEQQRFSSRQEAVRFAARQASQFASNGGRPAYLSIEGEDGVWRLFGHDLKAPVPS
jgi:hypothetical protein